MRFLQPWRHILIILSAFVLLGCATIPERSQEQNLGLFPSDYSFFLLLNMENASERIFIENIIKETGFIDIDDDSLNVFFERARQVYFTVRLYDDDTPPDIFLLTLGQFPAGLTNLGFCFNKDWDRSDINRNVWFNELSGFQLSVLGKNRLCLSNGSIEELIVNDEEQKVIRIPGAVTEAMKHSELLLYVPPPAGNIISGFLENTDRFPVNEFFAVLDRKGDVLGFSSRFFMKQERDAKLFTVLLKIVLLAEARSNSDIDLKSIIETAEVKAEDISVYLSGMEFTEDELIFLIKPFLNPSE